MIVVDEVTRQDPLVIAAILLPLLGIAGFVYWLSKRDRPVSGPPQPLSFWEMAGAVALGNLMFALGASLIYLAAH